MVEGGETSVWGGYLIVSARRRHAVDVPNHQVCVCVCVFPRFRAPEQPTSSNTRNTQHGRRRRRRRRACCFTALGIKSQLPFLRERERLVSRTAAAL